MMVRSCRSVAFGVLFPLSVLAFGAAPAGAASNPNARVLVHLTAPVGKAPCLAPGGPAGCADIQTAGDLSPASYYALVMVTNGRTSNGVGAVEFGIEYDDDPGAGVDIFSWSACGTSIPTGAWPASGSGNHVNWSACQSTEPDGPGTGVSAIAGYFYLSAYSSDALAIKPHPEVHDVRVIDCSGTPGIVFDTTPPRWGSAAFSPGATTPGDNPCLVGGNDTECLIEGPAELDGPTAAQVYSIEAPIPGAVYQWSATAPLMIVGPTSGTSVTVRADVAGVGELIVSGASFEGAIDCRLAVRVGGACTIIGPDEVAGEDVVLYTSPNGGHWSVEGDATLIGVIDGAIVQASKGGSFTVRLSAAPSGPTCSRVVTILPAVNPGSLPGASLVLDLYRVPGTGRLPCHAEFGYETPPCAAALNHGGVYPPDAYYAALLAVTEDPAASFAGARFGITYDDAPGSGVDIYSWHDCPSAHHAGGGSGGFPHSSSSGFELRWSRPGNCQGGTPATGPETVVLVGYFYLSAYTPGTLSLGPHPIDGRATLYDCDLNPTRMLVTDVPSPFGVARFSASGTEPGYNPCASAVSITPSTWSRIKRLGR
jgi:hypothetical protein